MIILCYDWVCYDHKIESNENRATAILKQTDFRTFVASFRLSKFLEDAGRAVARSENAGGLVAMDTLGVPELILIMA